MRVPDTPCCPAENTNRDAFWRVPGNRRSRRCIMFWLDLWFPESASLGKNADRLAGIPSDTCSIGVPANYDPSSPGNAPGMFVDLVALRQGTELPCQTAEQGMPPGRIRPQQPSEYLLPHTLSPQNNSKHKSGILHKHNTLSVASVCKHEKKAFRRTEPWCYGQSLDGGQVQTSMP